MLDIVKLFILSSSSLFLMVKSQCPMVFMERMEFVSRNNQYGDVNTIQCKPGYVLQGSRTAFCQENKKWYMMGKCVRARGNMGPSPQPPPSSAKCYDLSFEYKAVINDRRVKFDCVEGYILHGKGEGECDSEGRWRLEGECRLPIEENNNVGPKQSISMDLPEERLGPKETFTELEKFGIAIGAIALIIVLVVIIVYIVFICEHGSTFVGAQNQ